jgi:hypothetical protein
MSADYFSLRTAGQVDDIEEEEEEDVDGILQQQQQQQSNGSSLPLSSSNLSRATRRVL